MGMRMAPLISAVFIMFSFLFKGGPYTAHAASFAETEITVKCVTAENVPADRRNFSYTLTADSEEVPMPEGSDGRTKTVRIKESDIISFGSISFSHPEVYRYTVRETTEEWSKFRRDKTVYKIEVLVDSNGNTHTVIRNSNGEKVDKMELVNRFYLDRRYMSPKMGDLASVSIYVILASGSLIVLWALLKRYRSERKKARRMKI